MSNTETTSNESLPSQNLAPEGLATANTTTIQDNSTDSTTSHTITGLPAEIHLKLFKQLHPTDAVCLGLTNKYFWAILERPFPRWFPLLFVKAPNRRLVLRGSLRSQSEQRRTKYFGDLPHRLGTWMKPRILFDFNDYRRSVFVGTQKRYDELYRQWCMQQNEEERMAEEQMEGELWE